MISVILPVYNVEKYISDCLNSLINQTSENYEIIVVNDGTKDDSRNIAEKILVGSKVPYKIEDTENRGVSAARNTGLKLASGEYSVMVDSDDILSPNFLSDFEKLVNDNPESDVLFCDYLVMGEEKAAFEKTGEKARLLSVNEAQTAFLDRTIRFLLPAMLVKTEWIRENHIYFDEAVRYSEDVQFIWRALAYTKNQIAYLPEKNYHYLLHGGSTMTASGVEKILTGCDGVYKLYDEIGNMLSEPSKSALIPKWMFAMLHGAAKMMEFKDFLTLYSAADADKYIKEIKSIGDSKSKAVAAAMSVSKKSGYLLMKRF